MRSDFETPEMIRVRLENALHAEVAEPARIMVSIDRLMALALIGNLQIALRHPGNTGLTSKMVRRFIDELEKRLPPAMRECIAMGFDPAFDKLVKIVTEKARAEP